MVQLKDVTPILTWAKQHGDAKIVQRIVVRALPQLQAAGLLVSPAEIEAKDQFLVPVQVFEQMRLAAEAFVHNDHPEASCHV